jgi:hypothetical protein
LCVKYRLYISPRAEYDVLAPPRAAKQIFRKGSVIVRKGYERRGAGRKLAARAAVGLAAGLCGLFAALALFSALIVSGTLPEDLMNAAFAASVGVAALIFVLCLMARRSKR